MPDDLDLFDSALALEEQHYREGYSEGIQAGRSAGRQEGKALGVSKGFEVGHEIGYYAGFAQIWRQLDARNPGYLTPKADKAVATLEEKLRAFPLANPRDEGLHDAMDTVRGRFKTACAMLGVPDVGGHAGRTIILNDSAGIRREPSPAELLQF